MTWLISDALQLVREYIQDTRADVGYRHTDAKLIRLFNGAISDARRLRPDLFLPNINAPQTFYAESNLGDPFPLDGMYFLAVVEYITGMIEMADDEFSVDGRAIALQNRFTQKLTSKGA